MKSPRHGRRQIVKRRRQPADRLASCQRPRSRRGFTLLELMLALAIAGIVLLAVGAAMYVHLRLQETGRREVEEAQLARALLRQIADDLRAAVRPAPSASSPAAGLGSASSSTEPSESFPGGADGEAAESDADEADLDQAASETSTADGSVAESLAPPIVPGLYGNQFELQVDVARLPRADQYQPWLAPGEQVPFDAVSDVKTVAYYLQPQAATGAAGNTWAGGGLVRREMDRAATLWASQQGDPGQLQRREELLAPEVAGIEFLYFDGVQWWPQWDSTLQNGLPLAVEIVVTMTTAAGRQRLEAPASDASMTMPGELYRQYRLVVQLPAAEVAAGTVEETAP